MENQESVQLLEEMQQNSILKCVKCSSPFIIKKGSYEHKDGTQKQRYFCNECKKWFVFFPTQPKPEMKVKDELLDYALRLRRLGFSYNKIKNYIEQRKSIKVSTRAVWNALRQ